MFTLSTQKKAGQRSKAWTHCLILTIVLVSTALEADPVSFTVFDFSLAGPNEATQDTVQLDLAPSVGHFTIDITSDPSGTGQSQSTITIARQGMSGSSTRAPSRPSGNTSTHLQPIKKPSTKTAQSSDQSAKAEDETHKNGAEPAQTPQKCSANADLPNILRMPDGGSVSITLTPDANQQHVYYLVTSGFTSPKHNNTPLNIGNRHDEVLTHLHQLSTSWNYHYWYQQTLLTQAIQELAALWNNVVSDLLLGVNCNWLIEAVVVVNQDNTEEATLTGFHFQHEQTNILIQFDNPPGLAPSLPQTTHLSMDAPVQIHQPQAGALTAMTFAGDSSTGDSSTGDSSTGDSSTGDSSTGDSFVAPLPDNPSLQVHTEQETPAADSDAEEPRKKKEKAKKDSDKDDDGILGYMEGLAPREPSAPIPIPRRRSEEENTEGVTATLEAPGGHREEENTERVTVTLETLGEMFQVVKDQYAHEQCSLIASVPYMDYEKRLRLQGRYPGRDDDEDDGNGAGSARNYLGFHSN